VSTDAHTIPAQASLVTDAQPPLPLRGPRRSELAETRLIATLGTAALLLMVVGAFVLVALAAGHATLVSPFSRDLFQSWMAGPLASLGRQIHIGGGAMRLDLTIGIGVAFLCWLMLLACGARMHPRIAIAGVVVLHVIFFLSPPVSLTDVFNYLNYGRMGAVHGLNPYTTAPMFEPHTDPTFLLSNWHNLLSPYGPLFTLFSYALVPLGVAVSFWVFKALLLATALATLRLVWRCAELLDRRPLPAVLFVGANPLVLYWGLGGDHNDFLFMFFLMLGVYLLLVARQRRREASLTGERSGPSGAPRLPLLAADAAAPRWWLAPELYAGIALVAAVAIKAPVAVLLPMMLFATPRWRQLLIGMAVGGVVLGAASLIAFGPYLPDLATQSRLVTAESLPNLLGFALGQGGESDAMRMILNGVLVVAVIGAAAWAWRTRRWIEAAGFGVLALLATLSWELPWYVYWLLPLAALARGRALRIGAIVMSAYLILAWMPLVNDFLNAVNFHPGSTALARHHQNITKSLLH
jgi:hypothetical protein